jgi:hypothetical protein
MQERTIDEYKIKIFTCNRYKSKFQMSGQFFDFFMSGRIHRISSTKRDEAVLCIWTEIVRSYLDGTLN